MARTMARSKRRCGARWRRSVPVSRSIRADRGPKGSKNMRCPFCGCEDTQVKDSRPTDDRGAIRRRRLCPNCAARFTTFERVINSIVRQLESSGETDIPSEMIGELVMESLATLDQVAYVRFASVYRNFREAKDFGEFVHRIGTTVDGDD